MKCLISKGSNGAAGLSEIPNVSFCLQLIFDILIIKDVFFQKEPNKICIFDACNDVRDQTNDDQVIK